MGLLLEAPYSVNDHLSLEKCTRPSVSARGHHLSPERKGKHCVGVSAGLQAHEAGDATKAFLSNQRVSTSPVKLPKQGTHRAFQNPRDMETLGKELPAKVRSS